MKTYSGYTTVTEDTLQNFYLEQDINPFTENQYVICENGDVLRYSHGELVGLEYNIDNFKPLNQEQKMAFDLLENREVPIKALVGIAGSGKTIMALKFGLKKLKNKEVRKIIIVRQPSPVGESVGHIKGTKETKLEAWFKPIQDNGGKGWTSSIEFEIPAYMQGRSLDDTFIIVDEAQLLTDDQVEMLGSRVGKGSEIVFCGDYDQVFNNKYKGSKNGLVKMIDLMAGYTLFGIVKLIKSERSPVAELFATIFRKAKENNE